MAVEIKDAEEFKSHFSDESEEARVGRPMNDDRTRARLAGEKTYIGTECSRGHTGGVRYVINKVCIQCAAADSKASYARKKRKPTNY